MSASPAPWTFLWIAIFTGCSGSSSPVHLQFEKTEIDCGLVVDGTVIAAEFPFVVRGRNVVINSLRSSCQCIATSSVVGLGEQMKSGASGVIHLSMDVADYGGRFMGSVEVETDPPQKQPIILRVGGIALSPPKAVGVQPLNVTAPLNSDVLTKVDVIALRPQSSAPFQLDLDRSDFGEFSLVDHAVFEEILRPSGAQTESGVRERHRLSLLFPAVNKITTRESKISIAWGNFSRESSISIKMNVFHPASVQQQVIFVGYLVPGQLRELFVPFVRRLPEDISIQGNKGDVGVEWNLSSGNAGLDVKLIAPAVKGRFVREISYFCGDAGNVEPYRISIQGIVR